MRFLHTGDWHVGKAIRGRSRHDEFAAVLAEVVGVAVQEGVDAALVGGDAAALFDATETWYQSYAEGVGQLLSAMAGAFRDDRVNVLMAHLFTDGALLGGGEREVKTGLEYAVSPSRLPGTASYVALGHI